MGKTVAQYNLWVNLDLCRAARAGEQPNNLGQHAKLLGGAMHVAQKARKRGAPAPRDAAVLEAIHGDAACALSLFLLDNADMPLPSDFEYSTDDVLPMAYVPLARGVQAAYRWLYADMRLLLLCPCCARAVVLARATQLHVLAPGVCCGGGPIAGRTAAAGRWEAPPQACSRCSRAHTATLTGQSRRTACSPCTGHRPVQVRVVLRPAAASARGRHVGHGAEAVCDCHLPQLGGVQQSRARSRG